jgi:hypothetical protein
MNRGVVLLAWWFLIASGGGDMGAKQGRPAVVVGPFLTELDCQQIAFWHRRHGYGNVSWCWWDGKP